MALVDMFDVRGQTAVITGGASGIGLAFSEAMAESGARVAMLDMNPASLEQEVARLKRLGFDVRGHVADITDHARLDAAFDDVAAELNGVDIVFANAGIDPGPGFLGFDGVSRPLEGALENYDDARWAKNIDVNLNGTFATLRAAARTMKPTGRGGSIVVTTSVASYTNAPTLGAAYMASKAGVAHLMRNVALELAPHNIRVNAIAPGPFITNIGGGWLKDEEAQKGMATIVPLGRVAQTSEMKGLALFLASKASSYVTGAHIPIDGAQGLWSTHP
jgi:NAD(P)-dependent dehydrogenase (short-subunit alcohol dehydrogenase family)